MINNLTVNIIIVFSVELWLKVKYVYYIDKFINIYRLNISEFYEQKLDCSYFKR